MHWAAYEEEIKMATVEATQSRFDVVKLMFALLLLAAGIVGFYYYAEQFILLYRVIGLVAVASVSLLVVYSTERGKSLWQYFQDARTELRKVVWPSRTETTQTTVVVAIVVVLVGFFLWLLDVGFGWAIRQLLSL
jgi:preprotein translocase subunit SecE